ncbi:DUF6236 family protein [Nocardia vinacea]|uniref:DUF6236 family protein n=1 Tax=Nocardia vinacea TaxID=96468 RepID=UPI002E158B98|nr:DUF6236 family protein [Nocardia vinacea]
MPDLFYYPKINAPQSVIYQALLYWDRLVTVAPAGPLEAFLSPQMRQVHDAGLYVRLPAQHWPLGTADLERALWTLTRLLGEIPADDLIPHSGPDNYVHLGKLSSAIIRELRHRGLLEWGSDRLHVCVSAATQLCLISVAARDLAARYRGIVRSDCLLTDSLYPYTDSPAAHHFAHSPLAFDHYAPGAEEDPRSLVFSPRFPNARTMPCWEIEIGGLLPVPGHEVRIQDLIAFRERYSDERRRLIMAVDRLVRGLQRDYDHPRDVLHAVQRELEEALADLKHAGRAARITWVQRSLTLSIALAAGYAGQKLLPEAGWILGVIGGTAINVATNSTRSPTIEMADDISYLHRVQSALGDHHS